MAIVMKMDDARLIFVNGRNTYGYKRMCIWVESPKLKPILSIISINKYIESNVNKLINNLLKNILLAAREDSMKMAEMFIKNPKTPMVTSTTPFIQYRNAETIVLSISENSGQNVSIEKFIVEVSSDALFYTCSMSLISRVLKYHLLRI